MRNKTKNQIPPDELVNAVSLARAFHSQRTARELWYISERILRQEGIWPRNPFLKTQRSVTYSGEDQNDVSLIYKRVSQGSDLFLYLPFAEGLEDVSIHRNRGHSFTKYSPKSGRLEQEEAGRILRDCLKMQLSALSIGGGERTRFYEF